VVNDGTATVGSEQGRRAGSLSTYWPKESFTSHWPVRSSLVWELVSRLMPGGKKKNPEDSSSYRERKALKQPKLINK
jgi:hypothetical protein